MKSNRERAVGVPQLACPPRAGRRRARVVAATFDSRMDVFDLRGPGVYAATQCMCAVRQ